VNEMDNRLKSFERPCTTCGKPVAKTYASCPHCSAPLLEETSGMGGLEIHCRTCNAEVLEQAVACLACGVPPLRGNKFCWSCGSETNPQAVVCIKCGVDLRHSPAARASVDAGSNRIFASDPPKDPVLMGVLSGCLIAGLGQMVLGQTAKGVAILLGSIVLAIFTVGISILVTWPAGGIDAYLIAKKLKEGRSVGQWEFF
jgi:TM2 domain-containing membrane protein YozV/ribosomal protein L40E